MRLIDADDAKRTYTQDMFDTEEDFERVNDVLDYAPTVDAVVVTRCKDCKYGDYDSKSNGAMVCMRTNDGFWRKETDFCSYVEHQTNTGGSNNVAD